MTFKGASGAPLSEDDVHAIRSLALGYEQIYWTSLLSIGWYYLEKSVRMDPPLFQVGLVGFFMAYLLANARLLRGLGRPEGLCFYLAGSGTILAAAGPLVLLYVFATHTCVVTRLANFGIQRRYVSIRGYQPGLSQQVEEAIAKRGNLGASHSPP